MSYMRMILDALCTTLKPVITCIAITAFSWAAPGWWSASGMWGGVKSFKLAYFEHQHLDGADTHRELDEIVTRASQSGWRPMVRSVSRRSGEHVYIYAQDAGKDLKLLVVNVEPNEAEVIQVKVDPKRLEEFIAENVGHLERNRHSGTN